jgi:hypothetical protein
MKHILTNSLFFKRKLPIIYLFIYYYFGGGGCKFCHNYLQHERCLIFSYFEYYQIWLNILTGDCYMKLHYKIEKHTHTHTHKNTYEWSLYFYLKNLWHTQNIRLQVCMIWIKRHVRCRTLEQCDGKWITLYANQKTCWAVRWKMNYTLCESEDMLKMMQVRRHVKDDTGQGTLNLYRPL